jgi:muramoyltetrapeptide carboxypeptidase
MLRSPRTRTALATLRRQSKPSKKERSPGIDRVHIIAHANPASTDIRQLGLADTNAYLDLIRRNLPRGLRLTYSRRVLEAIENPRRGGRVDDAARIRDLQGALDDPRTLAIVATNGGAYFSRLLPHLDFTKLAPRRTPLTALGFSEMTGLVNRLANQHGGRGIYWLCPNYLAWKVRPRRAARNAFAAFWTALPDVLGVGGAGRGATSPARFRECAEIRGRLVSGQAESGTIRLVGGCVSVLTAVITGRAGRAIRPDGRWLAIEDVNEAPYRIDRHLAALKLAGWFDRLAGVLVGDFHTPERTDQRRLVVEFLRHHLPRGRDVPIVVTRSFGHVWPMAPLLLNAPLRMEVRDARVRIATPLAPPE